MAFKNRKAIKLFLSLQRNERNRFLRELSNNLGAKHVFVKLLKMKTFPEDNGKVWKKLYPKKPYDDREIRRILNRLTVKVEAFIAILRMEQDEFLQMKLVLQHLLDNQAFDTFDIYYNEFIAKLTKEKDNLGNQYYKWRYEVGMIHHEYRVAIRKRDSDLRGLEEMMERHEVYQASDTRWVHEKLLEILIEENQGRSPITTGNSETKLNDEGINKALIRLLEQELRKNDSWKGIFGVRILYYAILLQRFNLELNTNHIPDIFLQLKVLFLNHRNTLDLDIQKSVLSILLNYVIRQNAITGNVYYLHKAFELYDFASDNALLFTEDSISLRHYRNFVVTALKVGKAQKADELIKIVGKVLNPTDFDKTYSTSKLKIKERYSEHKDYLWFTKGLYKRFIGELDEAFMYLEKILPYHKLRLDAQMELLEIRFEQSPNLEEDALTNFKAMVDYRKKHKESEKSLTLPEEEIRWYEQWFRFFSRLSLYVSTDDYNIRQYVFLREEVLESKHSRTEWFLRMIDTYLWKKRPTNARREELTKDDFLAILNAGLNGRSLKEVDDWIGVGAESLDRNRDILSSYACTIIEIESNTSPLMASSELFDGEHTDYYEIKLALRRFRKHFHSDFLLYVEQLKQKKLLLSERAKNEWDLLMFHVAIMKELLLLEEAKHIDMLSMRVIERLDSEAASWLMKQISKRYRELDNT